MEILKFNFTLFAVGVINILILNLRVGYLSTAWLELCFKAINGPQNLFMNDLFVAVTCFLVCRYAFLTLLHVKQSLDVGLAKMKMAENTILLTLAFLNDQHQTSGWRQQL